MTPNQNAEGQAGAKPQPLAKADDDYGGLTGEFARWFRSCIFDHPLKPMSDADEHQVWLFASVAAEVFGKRLDDQASEIARLKAREAALIGGLETIRNMAAEACSVGNHIALNSIDELALTLAQGDSHER